MNVRDWLYVDEHCKAIYLTLTDGVPGEVYNIGGGVELTNVDLTYKLLGILGVSESAITFVEDRFGHDKRYSVNDIKLRSLGYKTSVNFDEKLESTVKWYMKNHHLNLPMGERLNHDS